MMKTCKFVLCKEIISHLFYCEVARYVWDVIAFTFDIRRLRSNMEGLCHWVMSHKESVHSYRSVGCV